LLIFLYLFFRYFFNPGASPPPVNTDTFIKFPPIFYLFFLFYFLDIFNKFPLLILKNNKLNIL
ncbi:MAG: hypothetical protein ACP5O4_08265, partial [bacterium]